MPVACWLLTLPLPEMTLLIRSEASRQRLPEIPDENVYGQANSFVSQADIVIVAVKPQDFWQLAPTIRPLPAS